MRRSGARSRLDGGGPQPRGPRAGLHGQRQHRTSGAPEAGGAARDRVLVAPVPHAGGHRRSRAGRSRHHPRSSPVPIWCRSTTPRWHSAGPAVAPAATATTPSSAPTRSCRSWPPLWCSSCPSLIGMFWGAPLIARELETGTFRLAWTQSVSRMRWLLVKLGLVGLASAAVGGLLSLMVTWWYSPIDKVNQGRFGAAAFGLHGFVPAGYALFAFALGATDRAALPPHAPRHGGHARRLHRRRGSLSPTGSGRTS